MWMPALARMSSRRSVLLRQLGRHAHDGEIRRTAAKVDDHRKLFPRHRALVVERGGNRFELEGDGGKARGAGDRLQLPLGAAVGRLVVIDEPDRPAKHHRVERPFRGLLRPVLHLPEIKPDDLGEGPALRPYRGFFRHRAGAKHALESPHQPPFDPLDIGADRGAAEADMPLLEGKEDRAGQHDAVAFQRQETGRTISIQDRSR